MRARLRRKDSLYYIDDIIVPLFEPISGTAVVPSAISALSFYREILTPNGVALEVIKLGQVRTLLSLFQIRLKFPTQVSLYHEQDLSDDSSLIISARKSTVEVLFDLIADKIIEGAILLPSFQDAYVQHYYGNEDYSLKTRYIHARTKVEAKLPDDEAEDQSGFSAFNAALGYDLIGAEYKSLLAGLAYEVSPYVTRNGIQFSFGDSLFDLKGTEYNIPLRTQIELSETSNLYLGSEWKFLDYYITLSLPNRKVADNAEDPNTVANIDISTDSKIVEFATWLTFEQILGKFLISPSLRVFGNSRIKKDGFDPRVIMKYRLSDVDNLKIGVGQYSAAPTVERLEDEFGNPDLPWRVSTHYSLGWDTSIKGTWTSNLQLFHKYWDNEITEDRVENFLANATKTSRGLEWFLRFADGGPTFGWLSYTYSKTLFKKSGEPNFPIEMMSLMFLIL